VGGLSIALGSVFAAILVRKLLDPILGSIFELPTVFSAVAVAAWFGGPVPAIITAVAGYLAADYLFMEPRGSVGGSPEFLAGIGLYLVSCAVIIFLGMRGRRAEIRRRQAEQKLLGLVGQLQEAGRTKDEFLATLAHELRNPLAPIRNASFLLKQQEPPDSDAQWARQVIDRQSAHLSRLVDDLLDVSRITRGKVDLRRERTSISTVVGSAVETVRPIIQSHQHGLTVSLPGETLFVFGDFTRLAQVLSNLLTNAAKYTPPKGRIEVAAERDGECVVLRVSDSGVGIPREMLGAIFEMFTQVDSSLERTAGGLGIGLTLAKRLVELHGGTIEAKSDGPGRGSEFVVRLPLMPASEESPATVPGVEGVAGHEASGRALVVDDNRDTAESLSRLLAMDGYDVRMASSGMEALREAAAFHPDVVILDIGLPLMNGYDVARRIRREPWGERIRLVAVTGWGKEEDRRLSKEAGFDEHVVKPVDPEALRALIRGTRAETAV
jgi:signal transduction histidine kinase/CheY-like chemotaxis protein